MKKFLTIVLSVILIILVPGSSLSAEDTGQHGLERILDAAVSGMSLEEKVGQMLMTGVTGTELTDSMIQTISRYHIGGIVLYKYNFLDTPQTVKLIHQIQSLAGSSPLLIAVDQEGGKVSRLPMGTTMPGNMALGATGSTQMAYDVGKTIGTELKALGVNVNFAPVLDVNTNPDNPTVGLRSFGSDPQLVADLGTAYINGLQDAGIASGAKHFPGHGGTPVDSHIDLPVVPYDRKKLEDIDLKPFREAIDNNVAMLMTAHVAYPSFDDTKVKSLKTGMETYLPATLSEKILTGMLREELGFKGIIISDSIHMKAISDHFGPPEETAVKAIKAGVDIVVVLRNLEAAYNNLLSEVKNGGIPETRIDETIKRICRLKLDKGIIKIADGKLVPADEAAGALEEKIKNAEAIVGCAEHKLLEQSVADKAATLIRNDGKALPFKLEKGKKVIFFTPMNVVSITVKNSFDRILTDVKKNAVVNYYSFNRMNALSQEQKNAVTQADYIVLVSYSYNTYSRNPKQYYGAQFALDLVNYTGQKNKSLAVIAAGDPYDISYMPEAKAYLTVYGLSESNIQAGIKAVFGLTNPSGRLPVDIMSSGSPQVLYPLRYGICY